MRVPSSEADLNILVPLPSRERLGEGSFKNQPHISLFHLCIKMAAGTVSVVTRANFRSVCPQFSVSAAADTRRVRGPLGLFVACPQFSVSAAPTPIAGNRKAHEQAKCPQFSVSAAADTARAENSMQPVFGCPQFSVSAAADT